MWCQVELQNTSTVDAASSTWLQCDEAVQSPTSIGSAPVPPNQKDRQHSVMTYGQHCRQLQPTVVLRPWNGLSNGTPPDSKSAKNKRASDDHFNDDDDDVTVRSATYLLHQTLTSGYRILTKGRIAGSEFFRGKCNVTLSCGSRTVMPLSRSE